MKKTKKIERSKKAQIARKLYENGLTLREIAKTLNLSHTAIWLWLKEGVDKSE